MQPNLFIEDTQQFLINIENEIRVIYEKSVTPLETKPEATEIDYNKIYLADHLYNSSKNIIEKMYTLIDLTKGILHKNKQKLNSPRFDDS